MRVLVPIADGVEEIEAVTVIDVLRRAGADVVVAGADGVDPVTASRGVRLVPDAALVDVLEGDYDLVALPGGLGQTERLCRELALLDLLRRRFAAGQWIAAICAAPRVLAAAGIASELALTSHPSQAEHLRVARAYRTDPVVEDRRVITSRGAGTALAWSLHLVERLLGPGKRREVEGGLATEFQVPGSKFQESNETTVLPSPGPR
jgi:4-methyl-5(b-hydroxyethyl)-thiazole monophosphate biosynthesis